MTHEKILFLYISAIESGDLEALSDIWKLAEDDPKLSAKLVELNAEIGDTPMAIYNGKVHRSQLPERRQTFRIPFTRVAILLVIMAGIVGVALSLSQPDDNETISVPLFGTTPTPTGPDNLVVMTKDNVGEMVQIERYGSGIIQGAVWSHNGTQIIGYGESLWIFDAGGPVVDHFKRYDLPFIADMGVLAGDGTQLAIANKYGQSAVVDLNGGMVLPLNLDGEITGLAAHENLIARIDGDNNLVYVWDSELGRERIVIRSLEDNVNALAFSEDGSMLAASGSVRAISRSGLTGSVSGTGSNPFSLTFGDPAMDHVIQVFDTVTWEMIAELDNPAEDYPYVAIGFNDHKLYATFADTVHWWDLDDLVNTLPAGTETISVSDLTDFTFLPDGGEMVGISVPRTQASSVVLLAPNTLDWLQRYDQVSNGFPKSIDVDNQRILVTSEYAITVYDAAEKEPLMRLDNLTNTLFDAEVSYPYAAYQDRQAIYVWDIDMGVQTAKWSGGPRDVDFTPDGSQLIIANGHSQTQSTENLLFWDFKEDAETWLGGPSAVALASNETGDLIAYISYNGELNVLDTRSQTNVSSIRLSFGETYSAARMDMTGLQVALTNWSHEIKVYDIETESLAHTLTGHSDVVANLSFSHDGSMMASVDLSGNVILWDTTTWEEINFRPVADVLTNLAFSADNQMLAVSSEREITVLDIDSLATLHQFQGHADFITGLDFDNSGKILVSAAHDGTLRIWGIPE